MKETMIENMNEATIEASIEAMDEAMIETQLPIEDLPKRKPELTEVISALKSEADSDSPRHSATVIYGLSDLTELELKRLAADWADLPASYKQRVLKQLHETSETVFELDFTAFAHWNLKDNSSLLRSAAIDLLWCDHSTMTIRQLMDLARNDKSQDVRAKAFSELGRILLLGEYGDIPEHDTRAAQELAHATATDRRAPVELRRRALEALANSSHPEVAALIREAYHDGDYWLKISAIFAMGRTCNNMWRDIVLEELESSDKQTLYEAIQACGALQLEDSLAQVQRFLSDEDREIQLMAIWALGEIGGKQAFDMLLQLEESEESETSIEDQEILGAIEDAVESASFSLDMPRYGIPFDKI